MVKPSPSAALEMTKADFLFQLEIISLDTPSKLGCVNKMRECDVGT
jgi:hypothetical protein